MAASSITCCASSPQTEARQACPRKWGRASTRYRSENEKGGLPLGKAALFPLGTVKLWRIRASADQAAFCGATLRRRRSAAAARPNRTIIGGAGTSVPLDVLVLVELLVLEEVELEEEVEDEVELEDDVELLVLDVISPEVEELVLLLVETSPEVEELVLLDTSPEVDELVLLETLPDVEVVLD